MIEVVDTRTISFGAAFIAGLLGSTHCLAMCGGFAGALGLRARAQSDNGFTLLSRTIATQAGRVASYAMAGALAGGFGAIVQAVLHLTPIALLMRMLAAVLLIAVALRIAFGWHAFASIERVGARAWKFLAPLARRATMWNAGGFASSLLLGALWGWLPCGLVYSMLAYAALSGGAMAGAITLFAFGLGTLPALSGGSMLLGALTRATRFRFARYAAAGLLASFALVSLFMLLPTFPHHH